MSPRRYLRNTFSQPVVRPWALATPILVLLICIPLLRPLRHPGEMSDDESLRLATIRGLVEHRSLDIESPPAVDASRLIHANDQIYSDQPPMFALLLAWPAMLMRKLGVGMNENLPLAAYVLTLIGTTLPVAAGAGLLYRMGRLFELPRPRRAVLATTIIFGSGLIGYSTVLNPHAPAAVLILCAAACLIHVSLAKLRSSGWSWVLLAGICAALAAALDPPAGIFLPLLLVVIATIRVPVMVRIGSILIFALGAAGPIALHAAWDRPITGSIIPGITRTNHTLISPALPAPVAVVADSDARNEPDADDVIAPPTRSAQLFSSLRWLLDVLAGGQGLFSHFPVLLFGIFGIAAVMHWHWPMFVKSLAAASATAALLILASYALLDTPWRSAIGSTRWSVVFSPMLLFWSGAWMRRIHPRLMWILAGSMLTFSIAIGLITTMMPSIRDDRPVTSDQSIAQNAKVQTAIERAKR